MKTIFWEPPLLGKKADKRGFPFSQRSGLVCPLSPFQRALKSGKRKRFEWEASKSKGPLQAPQPQCAIELWGEVFRCNCFLCPQFAFRTCWHNLAATSEWIDTSRVWTEENVVSSVLLIFFLGKSSTQVTDLDVTDLGFSGLRAGRNPPPNARDNKMR